MAKLLAYYSLCPINDVREYIGLSRDAESGCVINTLGRNIILIVKLSNQKQLCSWTVLDRLTSKVVYNFTAKKYIGVFANRHVRCWARDDEDINKVKKIKFFRNILDMHSLDDGRTLVMYEDGSCESFESALETRLEDKKNSKMLSSIRSEQTISKVSILTTNNGDLLLTYFVNDAGSNSVELNYALLDNVTLKPVQSFKKIKIERLENNVELVGYTVVDGSANPSLLSIWSDKRIFMQLLRYDITSHNDQVSNGSFISMLHMVNVEQPLSVIGINKDCVAIYANNTNQEGATLLLYNTQFKVVQSKQYFKIYFNNSRFWLCENNILLACGQVLAVVPFRISKEQLSDIIGSQRSEEMPSFIDNESINEDSELNDGFVFGGSFNTGISESDPIITSEKVPSSAKNTVERIEEINDDLKSLYRNDLILNVFRDETLPQDHVQIKFMSNIDDTLGSLMMSEHFEELANELQSVGSSEMEITSKLITVLIKTNSTVDLGKCLKRYNHVSEKALVKALKYALNLPVNNNVDKDVQSNGKSPKKVDVKLSSQEIPNQNIFLTHRDNTKHVDLLNIILSCSFNHPSILPYLRNELNLSGAILLLKHLYNLLIDPIETLSETPATCENFDNDGKVIEWVSLILDSHHQQLVLSKDKDIIEELVKWQEIVERHTNLLMDLKQLKPLMENILEKKVEKEKKFSKWYSIEPLALY